MLRSQYFCLFLLLVGMIGPAGGVQAEPPSHSDFRYLLEPNRTYSSISYLNEPGTEEDGGPGEYSLQKIQADFSKALELGAESDLLLGATYGARIYDFDSAGAGEAALGTETLHEISLLGGLEHFASESLYLQAHARGGLYSDLSGGVSTDDFNLEGQGMLVYRINPGTAVLLGVEASERFEDYPVFPLFGLRILSSDGSLHINLTAPIEAEVTYSFNTDLSVYGGYWIDGDRYNVDFGGAGGDFDIQVHDRRAGAGLYYWLGEHIRLGLEGGINIGSELTFESPGAEQFSGDLDPSPYLAAGLGLSF